MPNSQDYRLYLESEFKGLHSLMNAQFETVHERLEKIETQTTRTNGRVTKLESQVLHDLPHTKDGCPQKEIIDEMYDIVMASEAIKKEREKEMIVVHSDKVRILMVVGIFVTIIMSGLGLFFSHKSNKSVADVKTEVDMINTPVRTRGGVIEWWPSGVVIDTLKKQ